MGVTPREIDALVAEKVMGWTMAPAPFGPTQHLYQCWHANGQPIMTIHMWSPTEDIAAAWKVVEKMRHDGWSIIVDDMCSGDTWQAHFERDRVVCNVLEINTAPMAICLAALKAVGRWGGCDANHPHHSARSDHHRTHDCPHRMGACRDWLAIWRLLVGDMESLGGCEKETPLSRGCTRVSGGMMMGNV